MAKATQSQLEKSNLCVWLSLWIMTIQGGKSLELCQKPGVLGDSWSSLLGVTMHCLFHEGGRGSLTTATHTSHEALAHLCLLWHFLQRKRTRDLRKVIEDLRVQTCWPSWWRFVAFVVHGLRLCSCLHCAITVIQDVLFKLPILIPIPLETQEILTK